MSDPLCGGQHAEAFNVKKPKFQPNDKGFFLRFYFQPLNT